MSLRYRKRLNKEVALELMSDPITSTDAAIAAIIGFARKMDIPITVSEEVDKDVVKLHRDKGRSQESIEANVETIKLLKEANRQLEENMLTIGQKIEKLNVVKAKFS